MNSHTSIGKTIKGKLPRLPFACIKDTILGKDYEISVMFIGSALSRSLNRKYRNKDKPANILSFPLEKDAGEIFINAEQAKKDAHLHKKRYNAFILYLFVHGCLHLKGMGHSKKMDMETKRLCAQFGR